MRTRVVLLARNRDQARGIQQRLDACPMLWQEDTYLTKRGVKVASSRTLGQLLTLIESSGVVLGDGEVYVR